MCRLSKVEPRINAVFAEMRGRFLFLYSGEKSFVFLQMRKTKPYELDFSERYFMLCGEKTNGKRR